MASKQTLIVLSGGITKTGRLPFFVKNALNYAYSLYNKGVVDKIIVTGKWSFRYDFEPQKTEAESMKNYLIEFGVPEKVIVKEQNSQDLISSAYYLFAMILKPKNIKSVKIIGSDFQEERVRYIFDTLIGKHVHIEYEFVPSSLSPELLWECYTFERHTLLKTKSFFKKHNPNNLATIHKTFFDDTFYTKLIAGQVRFMVAHKRIGRKSGVSPHYSLARIFKKRKELFEKYGLHAQKLQTLKADFWSGRFLNFVGRNEDNEYYCLKFCLRPKDRHKFKNEILITQQLEAKGVDFVPTITASNLKNGPYWYIYKVVKGSMSGRFSIDFSFKNSFYASFVRDGLIHHLSVLRNMKLDNIPDFTSSVYRVRLGRILSKLSKHNDVPQDQIKELEQYVLKSLPLLDRATHYMSHNDLHPGNIVFSKSNKTVHLIDFEHVKYNNICFDFCFLYIFSWDNPSYQKKLYEQFYQSLSSTQKQEFDQLFPIVYGFFLLWLLDFVEVWKFKSTKDRYNQAKHYVLEQMDIVQEKLAMMPTTSSQSK